MTIREMIEEAIGHFQGEVSYSQIKNYVLSKWPNTNRDTITYQIIALSVNHFSRIHYPQNQKPREVDGSSKYDILYHTKEGFVEKYEPVKHGYWEIIQQGGTLSVIKRQPKTILFVWNPKHWSWSNLAKNKFELDSYGYSRERWSCGASTKSIKGGERFFVIKLGEQPKGIFASGYILSKPYKAIHWQREDEYNCVDLEFDVLLNPALDAFLTLDTLLNEGLDQQEWSPRASGISINPDYVDQIENLWFNITSSEISSPTNVSHYFEGRITQIVQNRYERNSNARRKCLEHHGYNCAVCEMNFESIYGDIGKEFIHVHHLEKISSKEIEYIIDPISNLRPVCPNCHAMIHKRAVPYTIEELKEILRNHKQ